ncbi:abortive infection system antitoxin AbiGi family protein [Macrococcus equipercicus]|uniref:Abortive phage resistance protein AbiGi, antitoxin n=1 Tax=Macrococcus equipercicus TaxID=69967 RepID=A0A9Q9BSI9_9STAP|nr:abortive infection system antitoxin AbiGi family protein [Macrococcus equipercicus]UTH13161.1 hypothetical protein KFV11_07765 [Macrococcus equipercicus]
MDNKQYYDSISSSSLNANMLIKYMKKFEYLRESLENLALSPRFSEENYEYMGLSFNGKEIKKLQVPMVCFCDIGFSRIDNHVKEYGFYGIALTKEWGLKNNITPIHYVIRNCDITNELKKVSNLANSLGYNELYSYVFNYCFYSKEIVGSQNGEIRLFSDEQEWRFIPKLSKKFTTIKQFYIADEAEYNFNHLSDAMKEIDELQLKFTIDDIKYIVVPDQTEYKKIIEVIKEINITDEEKILLYTKIRKIEESEDY